MTDLNFICIMEKLHQRKYSLRYFICNSTNKVFIALSSCLHILAHSLAEGSIIAIDIVVRVVKITITIKEG